MALANVGIVTVGNCASSLVQRIAFYGIDDARVVSAFDVMPEKVGRDLGEAIWAGPNNALAFAEVDMFGVTVRGRAIHRRCRGRIQESGTEVFVSLLPTRAQRESEAYAAAALSAGCAFVNCVPAVLARDP
jgi:myo-inositol-1-phosphate synthase